MEIIRLSSVGSTNDFLLEKARQSPQWEGVVTCGYQSNGKGMGTNRWESEDGKNLLFSILLHPAWLPIPRQYLLSMAQAVALRDVLGRYADGITIKWPNDIYWRDMKISGTRIDTNIKGTCITDIIIGTGVNVNQQNFISDAPNPVSLWQITKREHDVEGLLQEIVTAFVTLVERLKDGKEAELTERYHKHLYRREGYHWYEDEGGRFKARIRCVRPNGILCMTDSEGGEREYMFKEVSFVADPEKPDGI